MKPQLSIITINYNNKSGLEKTMQSVFAQTFSDIEYIVIDGASTDGSKELIEQNASKISTWVSEPDSGIYHAMNKGIAMAKGEYLQFLNSGDTLVNPDTIKSFFSVSFEADIVAGDLILAGTEKKRATNPAEISAAHLYESTILHPCSFIRKSLFEKIGNYDQSYRIVADYEFFVRAFIRHNASYEHHNHIIAEFDTTGISNQNLEKLKLERQRVLESYFSPLQLIAIRELYELKKDDQIRLLKWLNKNLVLNIFIKALTALYVRFRKN